MIDTDGDGNIKKKIILAEKINLRTGPVTVLLPLRGLSMIDSAGGAFWWPEADQALFRALKENLRSDIPVVELDCVINDPIFAETCVERLLENIALKQSKNNNQTRVSVPKPIPA